MSELQPAVQIQPLSREGKSNEAMDLFRSQTIPAFADVQKAIDRLDGFEKEQGKRNAATAAASAEGGETWTWTLALLVFSVVCCGGIGWYIVRGVRLVLEKSMEG